MAAAVEAVVVDVSELEVELASADHELSSAVEVSEAVEAVVAVVAVLSESLVVVAVARVVVEVAVVTRPPVIATNAPALRAAAVRRARRAGWGRRCRPAAGRDRGEGVWSSMALTVRPDPGNRLGAARESPQSSAFG